MKFLKTVFLIFSIAFLSFSCSSHIELDDVETESESLQENEFQDSRSIWGGCNKHQKTKISISRGH